MRVAGVEAAGDVGRGDVAHQLLVRAETIRAEALTHVAIEVYLQCASLRSAALGFRFGHQVRIRDRLRAGQTLSLTQTAHRSTEYRPSTPEASRKCFLDFRHLLAPLLSGRERFLEIDGAETGLVVSLGLGQSVAVRAYDGAYGRVAPAGDGVVHQDDGLDAARHLDGANGVAEVNHVGLVCPGTGRLFPLHEPELAALVAVADAISVSGDRPRGVKELLHALLGQPVAGEPDNDAQLRLFGVLWDLLLRDGHPDAVGAVARLAQRQLVALSQRPALVASKPDQGVGRAAVHEDGHVYPARHCQVGPRTILEVIEG